MSEIMTQLRRIKANEPDALAMLLKLPRVREIIRQRAYKAAGFPTTTLLERRVDAARCAWETATTLNGKKGNEIKTDGIAGGFLSAAIRNRLYKQMRGDLDLREVVTHDERGWTLHVSGIINPRSLRNFPAQSHGAEILRVACILATQRGVKIIATIHDAILIEAPIGNVDQAVAIAQEAFCEASRIVLGGFELTSDVKVITYPDRYMDEERGLDMWSTVVASISEITGVNIE